MESGSHNSLMRYGHADAHVLQALRQKYRLSPTQARVATLLADRLTNAEVASALSIKPSTARRHTEAVLLRMNVDSRFKVVMRLAELFEPRTQVA